MQRSWMVISFAGFILLVVVYLAIQDFNSTERRALLDYQEHQSLHAQHLADQIDSFYWGLSQRLQALTSFISLQYINTEKEWANIQTYSEIQVRSKEMEKSYVKEILLYDETGRVIYSTSDKDIGSNCGHTEFFFWATKKENKGKVFVSMFPSAEEERQKQPYRIQMQKNTKERPGLLPLEFLLTAPLYQGSPNEVESRSNDRFIGALSLKVDLREFLLHELKSSKMNFHQIWILNNSGKLIFHSEHPEMVLLNIHNKEAGCTQCHISFDYVEAILKEKQGTAIYKVGNFPNKIASFAPIMLENTSWFIVVNSPYDKVMSFIRKSLWRHLILMGLVALVFMVGSTQFIRNNKLKVRAQEEARHWREKQVFRDKIEASETRYRTIVETAHDIIWTVDTQGNFTFINKSGEEVSGYKNSELIGKNFVPFVHAEDLSKAREVFLRTLQGESQSIELRAYAKNGNIFILAVNTVPLYEDGEVIGIVSFGRDITERRKAEEALRESEKQLRYLSSQLLTIQEQERKRISGELHDELGQALAVIKLRLNSIKKMLKKDQGAMREDCESTLQYIDQVIENVRRLSRDLSPSILEDLGFSAALRWVVSEFGKHDHCNMKISLDIVDIDRLLSQKTPIVLYRIFQAALTNIEKHAEATDVSIVIKHEGERISFLVEDNGRGFNAKEVMARNVSKKGLGLATMNERVRMLGGSLELWSQEGTGTRIIFTIPVGRGEISNGILPYYFS